MCGIVGFLSQRAGEWDKPVLQRMAASIIHRGPDDAGYWTDADGGIGLGHRRLAIVDVSSAGHQPMRSASGRYVIVFNGEIYNHSDLRSALERAGRAPVWRGRSDTESLLAAFDGWGIDVTVTQTVGMFAFAVWDRQTRILTLGRDRLGEKPLYYGWLGQGTGSVFLFASELKALRVHPSFVGRVNRNALRLLLRHNCIPAPHSIYQDVRKLPPGRLMSVSLADREPRNRTYWSAAKIVEGGIRDRFAGTPQEAVDVLDTLLRDAVRQQMVADVPLGAFLSGGVDSSTVVALMQAQSDRPVRTFSIGFVEAAYNEAEFAKAVARHLGSDHTELYVSPQQARDVIPKLPSLYCEPFADCSQIPTFLVSQKAREHVTVSLSGDGGDELFGGYNRYVLGQRLWSGLRRIPVGVRQTLATQITRLSPARWNQLLGRVQGLLPTNLAQPNIGHALHKGSAVMSASNAAELYCLLVSHWAKRDDIVLGATEPLTALTDPAQQPQTDHFVHEMMALDTLTYLPDDVLCKVDRAAMGVSLETRVPLLDHRVVEFAWSLPLDYKLRDGVGKWPLRQVLHRYVPKSLFKRPKMGFGIPLDSWLRGPLRDWAEALLDETRLHQEQFFNPNPIRQKWTEHLSGKRDWHNHLWDILMFQAWLDHSYS